MTLYITLFSFKHPSNLSRTAIRPPPFLLTSYLSAYNLTPGNIHVKKAPVCYTIFLPKDSDQGFYHCMSKQYLIIEGARQNNLKNISLQIPHNKVTVITGISGSGKSSLAFDTIFAEGQWRYIESLSTYTRMFIEKIDRPDVDAIRNIRPAIAIEQKNPVRTARSTVGTATEIYDYLRLLFAKIGRIECPRCNGGVKSYNPTDVLNEIMGTYSNQRAYIFAPVIYSNLSTRAIKEVLDHLIYKGFFRIKIGEEIYKIPGDLPLDMIDLLSKDTVYVVIDRIIITTDNRSRITDSIEMAFKEGDGS